MNKNPWLKGFLFFVFSILFANLGINVLLNTLAFVLKKTTATPTVQGLFLYPLSREQILPRFLFTLILFSMFVYQMTKHKVTASRLNVGQFGSSRFSTIKEIKEQYKEIPDREEEYEGEGGCLVARYKDKLYIDDDTVNTIILGQTRSGKGELYVLPMIDILSRSEKKPSMVINDMKGELTTTTYRKLKNRGYDVHIINLIDPASSMRVNLLDPITKAWGNRDRDEAQLMIKSITHTIFPPDEMGDDAYWRDGAVSLVNGFILACLEKQHEVNSDIRLSLPGITLHMQEISTKKNGFDFFFASLPEGHPGKIEAGTFLAGTDKQRGTFLSLANSKLRNFTLDKFQTMMNKSDLDLENIGFSKTPQAVFLVIPDFDTSNHFLASLMVRQIYDANIKRASRTRNQRTHRRVHFLFDEFGNMPSLADMGSIVTAGLSRGLLFHLVLQDFEQLKKKYPEDASTIRANCGNLLYILSTDNDTLGYISDRCGAITTENYSGGDSSSDTTIQIMERPLISKDALRELKLWETIFLRSSKRVDRKGNPITAYPIDNRSKTKLKPRFAYLQDTFPSPPEESLEELTRNIYKNQTEKNQSMMSTHSPDQQHF